MQWLPAFARSFALRGDDAIANGEIGGVRTQQTDDRPDLADSAGESLLPQGLKPQDEAVPPVEAPADASAGPDPERRSEPRHDAEVMGRLRLPASEHDCLIADLSTGGMSIVAEDAVVCVGDQVVVVTQNFPRLVGVVRWMTDGVIGIHFQRPIALKVIERLGEIRRRVRSPRVGRARLELASVVYFDGIQHDIIVHNISVGGIMMTTRLPVLRGQRKLVRDGQALMIQFPELLPIGGHIRWTCGAKCGVAFSKLMPLPMAEEITSLGNLSDAWLDDVRVAHADFENG